MSPLSHRLRTHRVCATSLRACRPSTELHHELLRHPRDAHLRVPLRLSALTPVLVGIFARRVQRVRLCECTASRGSAQGASIHVDEAQSGKQRRDRFRRERDGKPCLRCDLRSCGERLSNVATGHLAYFLVGSRVLTCIRTRVHVTTSELLLSAPSGGVAFVGLVRRYF